MAAFCLEMHADYACRHAGACCTAGWAIPAEPNVVHHVQTHFRARELFMNSGAAGDTAIIAKTATGACVFYDRTHDGLCAIHRDLGPACLPSVCRHFPRVVLHDDRGTFISLSHFCPTAASMLPSDRPLRRVGAPGSLSLDDGVEGLDARGVLPPLLRSGMLTDIEGFDAWERAAIEVLARDDASPDRALDAIDNATRQIQTWRPGGETLAARVRSEFERVAMTDGTPPAFEEAAGRAKLARASVPAGLTLAPDEPAASAWRWRSAVAACRRHDRTVCRYLAARLFGTWIGYCGGGLHTIVGSLRVHLAVLRMEIFRRTPAAADSQSVLLEAIRASDLLLVHYADARRLARLIDATS